VKYPDATLRRLIRTTPRSRVRQLERDIAALMRKAARKIAGNHHKQVVVEPKALPRFWRSRASCPTARKKSGRGHLHRPRRTPWAGIYSSKPPECGQGEFDSDRSLRDVMKESAQTAVSYLRSQAARCTLTSPIITNMTCTSTFRRRDAKGRAERGITIVAALASLLHDRLVRSTWP